LAKITFHNKINPLYREIHVDGAHGGITTRGYINLSFYAERKPIPKSNVVTIDETGLVVGNVDSKDSKVGILREYEVGIYLDRNTAQELANFLQQKIKEIDILTNTENA
jgi:hypothetical protein